MNPYGVDIGESNLLGPTTSLKILYEEMPDTSGCETCEEKNGDNAYWCCLGQSPSMYYVEFLHIWEEVQKWSKQKQEELVIRAIRNYLSNKLSKGCVFYTDKCSVHEQRCLQCRLYGVIPKESWDERWEQLKKRQGDKFEAKPQCNLVKSETEITCEQEEKWFFHTIKCERRIGVPVDAIKLQDFAGGSYRTPHDHIVIELFDDKFLHTLTQARMNNLSDDDIDGVLETLKEKLNERPIQS